MQIKPYINRRKEIIKQKSIKQEITKNLKVKKVAFLKKSIKLIKVLGRQMILKRGKL